MPTNQETLDAAMQGINFGTHYTGTEQMLLKSLEHARGYATAMTQHKADVPFDAPYTDLVDDDRVNAFAFTDDAVDYIAITTGAIKVFNALFPTLLSISNLFPGLGDTGVNEVPKWQSLPSTATNLPEPIIPQNTKRALVASAITAFALDFLILHEAGHIIYGHTRWTGSAPAAGLRFLYEYAASAGPHPATDELLESHVHEMEADSYAISTMVSNIEQSLQGNGAYGKFAKDIGWTIEEAVTYWLFGVYTFFRLFSPYNADLTNQLADDHPLPIVRLAWVMQRLPLYVEAEALSIPKERIISVAIAAADGLEEAFSELTGQPKQSIDILTNQDPIVDQHLEAVMDKLEEIKQELNAVSYIKR